MRARTRRVAYAIGVGALVGVGLGAALGSRSFQASISAAYRAFRNPSLVEEKAPAASLPPVCAPETETGTPRLFDTALSSDFEPAIDEDLDDPEGATIASLVMPDLRVSITRRTMHYVRFFARTDEGRDVFLKRYRRAAAYRGHIEHALREAGLPEDLLWVAAIESGFDPRAVSPAGAAGLWQFMPKTGADYGLYQSPWVDERMSIARATNAAVAHLRDLYERFGRWDLALAAYNLGYDRVIAAMEKVLAARDPSDKRPIEHADLAQAGLIPAETANYVPQIMAFSLVAANRVRFGLDEADLALQKPLDLGEIAVPEGTRLRTIARAAGLSTSVVREINAQLLRDRVPPTGGEYLVTLPAERIARTMATFPAYLDHEVLAADDASNPDQAVGELPSWFRDPDSVMTMATEPLPPRPASLGRNRLPAFALPGDGPTLMPAFTDVAAKSSKLRTVLVGNGIGWNRAFDEDPLGILNGHAMTASRLQARDLAIEKQLGFLNTPDPERMHRFALPNGISIDLRRDPSAPLVAISAAIAAPDDVTLDSSANASDNNKPSLSPAMGETRYTITVAPRDLEVGISLAAGRLRLLLEEATDTRMAALRRKVSEPRREMLGKAPYGAAWLALGEALFPPGHPLEGLVVGARDNPDTARDLFLAESLRRERSAARASIALSGNITRVPTEELLQKSLGSFKLDGNAPIGPHPREERILVEDTVQEPHVLYGWIAAAQGDASEAALRVTMEILTAPRIARLSKVLVTDTQLATGVQGHLDLGERASVAVVAITPAPAHQASEMERRFDAEIQALASTGPTWNELALAKILIKQRLEKELTTTSPLPPGSKPITTTRIRNTLSPGSLERLIRELEAVTPAAVRSMARRTFARDHRVIVTTWPKGRSVAVTSKEPTTQSLAP